MRLRLKKKKNSEHRIQLSLSELWLFFWKFTAIAVINPIYIEEGGIFNKEKRRVGSVFKISNPGELELFRVQPENGLAENVVVDLLDWQVPLKSQSLVLEIDLLYGNSLWFLWSYII